MPDTHYSKYLALQRSMFITLFAAALAGAGFFTASLFVVKDKKKVEDALKGKNDAMTTSATSSEATHNSYELNVNSTVYTPITDQDMFQINHDKPIVAPEIDDVTRDDVTTARPPPYLSVIGKSPNGKQDVDEAKKSLLTPEATSDPMTSSVDSSRSSTRSNSFLLPDAKESVI